MTHEEAMVMRGTVKNGMTVKEAARRFRASEADVVKWCKAGLVPARKINGRWYVVKEASNG